MASPNVHDDAQERERLFRLFQIEKYHRRRAVPSVSLTIDIDVTDLQARRRQLNAGVAESHRVTLTHLLIKVVSLALMDFPILYSLFNGRRIVPSKQIRINIPVAADNHVEYVIVKGPDTKSIREITEEVRAGADKVRLGVGDFYLRLKALFRFPRFLRLAITNFMPLATRLAYKSYGNFPITNFGSFGVKNGTPVLSTPMIAVLCCGMIQTGTRVRSDGTTEPTEILPVTLVFDHRPIDGAYGGNFLVRLKKLMEAPPADIFV
jgi:pyruvate/2-oxoglutarate dehydrogenase complex dihydrolipoamide acyltransferase (E2) component